MPRALWKGAVAFGLVSIPVELYPAEERKEFKFSMLDKRDFAPVGYKRYNKKSGKEVDWQNVVKAYEYEKDDYVVLSDEDFKRANVKASQTIDILSFVPLAEISPQFYDRPYYLVPERGGQKAYALLRETLLSTGKVALAQVVIRTAQHLAIVVPAGRALLLNTLRYADELRDTKGLELPEAGLASAHVTGKEVELAKHLIDDMTGHWKPSDYEDSYHQDLMRRIREKIKKGETHVVTKPGDGEEDAAPRSAQVIDLAALLAQSLNNATHRQAGKSSPARTTGTRTAEIKTTRTKTADAMPSAAKTASATIVDAKAARTRSSAAKKPQAKRPALRAVAAVGAKSPVAATRRKRA